MKAIAMFLVGTFTFLSVVAQNMGTVTIDVKGNRNKEVLVDGKTYRVNTDASSTTTVNSPVIITGLSEGQHTLQVIRYNLNRTSTTTGTKSNFNFRPGYDLLITINTNGSRQLTETRIKQPTVYNPGSTTPMSDNDFDVLLENIIDLNGTSAKTTAIQNAFNKTGNFFTTEQAYQLLEIITSQSSRLRLAKLSYKTITDPSNFGDVKDLITSAAFRRDLAAYVKNYDLKNNTNTNTNTGNTGNSSMAMSSTVFNKIYSDAQGQYPASAKLTYLANVFANSNNYFSTAQAKQLIGVVYPENERLQLAKAAYDNVVDKSNFTDVYDLLSYQASRNELASFIGSVGNVNTTTPMSASNFNTLYLNARNQYSAGEKAAYINNVFNNSNNYFTTTQVKQLILLVVNESDRLVLAKGAWDNLTDAANYTQLYDLFTSQANRNEFAAFASSNGTYSGNTNVRVAMTESNFNNLYNTISNQFGLGVKMSSLTNAFNDANNYFSVAQVRQLVQLVSAEDNRLQLGKLAFNNVVDPENYSQLYDVLASQASRNELDAYVRANGGSTSTGYTPVKTPMTTENFNSLYNSISNTWGLGAKMSSLTNVFASTTNYFSTAQARQLIQLVSSETNRLTLAKSSYDNITDPENFSQLYDILESQASRNELAAYVNSYSYNR